MVNRLEARIVATDRQLGAIDRGDIDQRFVGQGRLGFEESRQIAQPFRLNINDLLTIMHPGGDNIFAKTLDKALCIVRLAGG